MTDTRLVPPQALEDRGIVELLLTSDNEDGLSKGTVDGGTCPESGPRDSDRLGAGAACFPHMA